MSPSRAVLIGQIVVNGPVFLLLFGPATVTWWFAGEPKYFESRGSLVVAAVAVGGFCAAWLWWSLSVPKWRVWAYERVSDLAQLKLLAVQGGLTWPDGWIFEKTEIKSKRLRALEEAAIRKHAGSQNDGAP